MIPRYTDKNIAELWQESTKVNGWQDTELAVLKAREEAGEIPAGTHATIAQALEANTCNLAWWKERENILHHDLNSWLEERMRFIPQELQQYFHQGLTSYDTEESGFVRTLSTSVGYINQLTQTLLITLKGQARKYCYIPMNKRTHGQEAEIGSFGCRCLTWHEEIRAAVETLFSVANKNLRYSKLSGAIGNYSGVSPVIEKMALKLLYLQPFYGATQIMPRVLYAPIASGLADLVSVLNKIAVDFRLGARSGRVLYQEPFGKKQKGSSAMPHKKNTIHTEKIGGMARMARGYAVALRENIETWEERDIAQSSVERVFWPDLFHVTAHALTTLNKVIDGMVVYPDHMTLEIVELKGCYASNEAKEFLTYHGASVGLSREDSYRIVQLAAFSVHAPNLSFDTTLDDVWESSIEQVIRFAKLSTHPDLETSPREVSQWNSKLTMLFGNNDIRIKWSDVFKPERALEREAFLFKEVFG